jgi:hypothetical protein
MIGVMPAVPSFAEKPTITGERVLLRPVGPADAAGLAALDNEALRLTGGGPGQRIAGRPRYSRGLSRARRGS